MKNTYTVIVEAPAVNQWVYEVTASSEKKAREIIQNCIDGDGEFPDPVSFEQGVELDGQPLEITDCYED